MSGSLYDVTSCLADWSYVPSVCKGVVSDSGPLFLRGVSIQGVAVQGLPERDPPRQISSRTVTSGRYASYWNVFLF